MSWREQDATNGSSNRVSAGDIQGSKAAVDSGCCQRLTVFSYIFRKTVDHDQKVPKVSDRFWTQKSFGHVLDQPHTYHFFLKSICGTVPTF